MALRDNASRRIFLEAQIQQLKILWEPVREHPLMGPPLEEQIQGLESELILLSKNATLPPPRTAIFFSGGGVCEQEGVDAELAGEALVEWQKMYEEQAKEDERRLLGLKTRRPGSAEPRLLLTSMPRGSVGLELVPDEREQSEESGVSRAESLKNVAQTLIAAVESDEAFTHASEEVHQGVLAPLRRFLKAVVSHHAHLRVVVAEGVGVQTEPLVRSFEPAALRTALVRVSTTVDEEEEKVDGLLQGILPDTRQFEFRKSDGTVIAGSLGADFDEAVIHHAKQLIDRECTAKIRVTTFTRKRAAARITYQMIYVGPRKGTGDTETITEQT